MKILIVGGTSALGCALRVALSPYADVVTAGRSGCDIPLDLSDPVERLDLPPAIDVIINTAAHFGGRGAFDGMDQAVDVNVLGTLKLCIASHKAKIPHLVQVSSINAYLNHESPYYGSYSMSKRLADDALQLFCSDVGLRCAVVRPSQIYGSQDVFRRHQTFLYAAVDKAQLGEHMVIYGRNDALRNYIHIDDLTAIMWRVVRDGVTGVYACAHPVDVRLSQIALAAAEAFGVAASVTFREDATDILDNVFPYDGSLYDKIGCQPTITLDEGMRRIAAYRSGRP